MRTTKFFISILTVAALTVTTAFSVSADNAAEYGNYDSSFTAQAATERVVPSADPDFEEITLEEFKAQYPNYKGIKEPRRNVNSSVYAVTPDPGYVTSKYSGPFVWKQVGSKWYLYASNGSTKVSTGGWYQENGYWYFLYPTGAKKYDGTTAAGEMAVGWEKIGSYWYYFNEYGQMSTSWRLINGVYYYFCPSGADAVPGYFEGAMITGEHYLPYAKGSNRYQNYYFNSSGAMQDWTYPLPSGCTTISSPFNDPNNGNHHGLDFKASTGTYIYAATNGAVKFAGFNSSMGYAVIMKSDVLDPNGNYLYVRYMHMNSSPQADPFKFSQEDQIATGDHIGYVGSTGYSTGPHLHIDVNAKNLANTGLHVDDAINPICFFSTKSFTNTSSAPLYWDRYGER